MEMKREMLYAALIILLLPVSTLTGVDVFRVPHSRVIVVEEGSEILLNCLPTIPSTTNFTLRMADGSALPPNLRFTVHPKQGILIHLPTPSHSGEYVCSMLVDTTWQNSSVFHITVKKKVRLPPSVTVDVDECIGVVGEELNLTCKATNPDHAFILKWQHSSNQTFLFNKTLSRMGGMVQVKGVITLAEVRESDAGNLTCIVENAAGKNTATVSLRITKKPFLSLTSLKPTVELREGETLELRVEIDAHPSIQNRTWSTPQTRSSSTYTETLSTVHRSYRQVASLSIRSLKADESGWYSFSARSANINATTYFKVHVVQKPSVVIEQKNSTLTCLASGYPTPRIHWQQCNETHTIYEGCDRHTAFGVLLHEEHTLQQRDDFQTHTVRSVLLTSPNSTMVECVAENKAGVGRSAITVPLLLYVSQPPHDIRASQIFLTIVTSTLVIATLLFFLLGVCVYRFIQTPKYEIQWKIIEVSEGNNYTYIDPIQLPYNLKWEFPRDRLTFGQVLGSGAFGKVVEATALGLNKDDHVTQVAVKMLKSSAHSEEKEALMCELKILSHIGSHANIVNLLGACTHGGPVLLITEFCCHGDLLNFLRRKAPYFMTSGFHTRKFSHIYKNLRENQSPVDSYMDMHPDQISRECTQGGESALNVDDLLRFSSHVAQGMNFLTSKNCIHRDVAARNVLLSDSLVAKICDFGLARDIMNDSNYVVRGNARLPVKWMSPESIFECLYTVQSDVWSYGILLWEIFSLGRSPYPDVVVDARFYKMIRCGYQMSQPDFAPDHMYKLMKMCWTLDPTSRPTFDAIVQMIKRLRPENSEQQQVYKNIQQEFVHNDDVMKWVNAETKENHCDVRAEEEERPLTHSNNYHLH